MTTHQASRMRIPAPRAPHARSDPRAGLTPCGYEDLDLWFSEQPADLERAKSFCRACPVRRACLDGALERGEPWGVWGGEILRDGAIIAHKRARGRPRKRPAAA